MVVCVDSTLWESFIHPLTMYGGSFSTLFCHTSPKEQINQVHSCCSFFFSPCVTLQYKIQWLKITQPFSEHPKSHKSGQMEICLLFTLKRSKNDADTVFLCPPHIICRCPSWNTFYILVLHLFLNVGITAIFHYYYLESEAFIINNLSVQVFWQPVRSVSYIFERDLIY